MMFTKYMRGMVYWAELPRYDINPNITSGKRPVIIVSNNVNNCISNNITVVPCTTNTDKNPNNPAHCILPLNKETPSLVLCEDIVTISKDLLQSFMGMIDEKTMEVVDKCLLAVLGLCEIPNPFDGPIEQKPKEVILEEKRKRNQGRRVSGPIEMNAFLNFFNQYGVEETMAEYGVPNRQSVLQRVSWYKGKLGLK